MNRDQLEQLLLDLCGETDKNLSWAGQRQVIQRVLVAWDHLQTIVDSSEDVIRAGSLTDAYFDGRPEGNGPGHRHEKPGVWDSSNETCGWCSVWTRLRRLLSQQRERRL